MRHHSTHTVQTRGLGRQTRFEGLLSLVFSFIVGLGLLSGSAFAADKDADSQGKPSIEDKTEGMQEIDGFFPLYWDDATGTLWMEIARFDEEVLHLGGLAAGLGSNDIGLDRGQMGAMLIVGVELASGAWRSVVRGSRRPTQVRVHQEVGGGITTGRERLAHELEPRLLRGAEERRVERRHAPATHLAVAEDRVLQHLIGHDHPADHQRQSTEEASEHGS